MIRSHAFRVRFVSLRFARFEAISTRGGHLAAMNFVIFLATQLS
jgi:hypothetical protein